jgi:hypothetical protein
MGKISKVNLIDIVIWIIALGLLIILILNSCSATFVKVKSSANVEISTSEKIDSINAEVEPLKY